MILEMILGTYDRLCQTCGVRYGRHSGDACPKQDGAGDRRFIESGKKRSIYCDRRNNPKAYENKEYYRQ